MPLIAVLSFPRLKPLCLLLGYIFDTQNCPAFYSCNVSSSLKTILPLIGVLYQNCHTYHSYTVSSSLKITMPLTSVLPLPYSKPTCLLCCTASYKLKTTMSLIAVLSLPQSKSLFLEWLYFFNLHSKMNSSKVYSSLLCISLTLKICYYVVFCHSQLNILM